MFFSSSGWTFSKILSANIVHIRLPANTLMSTYGRGAKYKLEFHPNLKSIFRYNVFDPIRLTPYRFKNSCVLTSIIIQLEYIKSGTLIHGKKKEIKQILQHLLNQGILNNLLDTGITLEQFNAIEDDKNLFNELKQFYPNILANFKQLSLNLFSCQHSNRHRAFHLIPIRLGKNHFSTRCLNIDLLKESKDIRPPEKNKKSKKHQNDEPINYFKHVLVILNFIRLHQTFRNYSSCSMASLRDTEICRR